MDVWSSFSFARRNVSPLVRKKKTVRQKGQALIETVMTTGFLVALAMVLNRLLRPVVIDAFEKISEALSSVGP